MKANGYVGNSRIIYREQNDDDEIDEGKKKEANITKCK
jgi:hypothetical protein